MVMVKVRVSVRVVVRVSVLSVSTMDLLTHLMFRKSAVRILPMASGCTVWR